MNKHLHLDSNQFKTENPDPIVASSPVYFSMLRTAMVSTVQWTIFAMALRLQNQLPAAAQDIQHLDGFNRALKLCACLWWLIL